MASVRRFPFLLGGVALVAAVVTAAILALSRGTGRTVARVPGAALANPDVSTGTAVGDAPAPPFTLIDQDGRRTSLAEFRGKVVVLAFIDAHCTTICPLMTESMIEALRLLGPAASNVQLLGIDANPLATRVADVAAYTRAHQMQGRWRFLTGPLPDLEAVWRGYHVYVAAVHGDIDHQPIIALIDARGRERRIYATQMSYEGVEQQAELIAEGVSRLLPGHPAVPDAVSLQQVEPLKPAEVVDLSALGPRRQSVVLGQGHPHLLLFFAGWLTEDSDLEGQLAVLDRYADAAHEHGWPAPAAIDEWTTEGSDAGTRGVLDALASRLHTPIVEDARGRLADGYGVQDLPWLVLTSPSGKILWHHDGWLTARQLDREVGVSRAAR